MPERMIVFVRAPRAGGVKTRLAQCIGKEAALAAYRILVERVLGQVGKLGDVQLRFTPPDAEAEIRPWLKEGWTTAPQCEGDLGGRLNDAFADAFRRGAERVVIIGSDCPYVTTDDIRTAWEKLRGCDVVIGPAQDGGYWLIGLRAPQPKLFEGIAWSSDKVLSQTLARARTLGVSTQLLRTLSDVDTEEDWRRFTSAAAQGRTQHQAPGAD